MTDVQDPAIQGNEKQENDSSSEVSLKQRFFRPQTFVSFIIAFVILYFLGTKIDINVEETMKILRGTEAGASFSLRVLWICQWTP